MDDDWGLHAVVRGCSAAGSGSGAAATATTTTTRSSPTSFVSDFDFQSLNNNNSSFLFSSSSFGSNSNNGQSVVGSGQLFSLSSDPIVMRPQRKNNNNNSNHRVFVDELYKPFSVPKPEANNSFSFCIASSQATTNTTIIPNTIISSFSSSSNDHQMMRPLQPLKQVLNNNNNNSSSTNKHSHAGSVSSSTAPRSKKRKNQMKKVCQVPAESLSSDIWAWRKYGQKPIKGSPYPRGYYRCSSSKGCLARKQVERNRSDPAMFIVTYTSEHNHPAPTHRNSLAGSTRQKPSLPASSAAAAKPSSPATSPEEDLAAALSGSATESKDGPESSTLLMEDEEDDEFGLSDMAVSDDFFVGLEGLGAPAAGDYISDNFPASFGLPLSASSAATAAGGS